MASSNTDLILKRAGQLVLVGAAYFIFGKLGLTLAVLQPNASAIWAPTGIAIAALLYFGYGMWPAIFIGAFFVNVTTAGTPVWVSLVIAVGNTCEGLFAAYLLHRLTNSRRTFLRAEDVFRFSFFAGAVSPVISATVGVMSVTLAGLSPWANYFSTWTTWWLGDMGGAIIVAPFLLLWCMDHTLGWEKDRVPELILMFGLVVGFSFLVLVNPFFIYLMVPIFVWAALRFKQRDTMTAVFIFTEVLLWGTLHGQGPFAAYFGAASFNSSLLAFDAAVISVAVTIMALTAVMTEERNMRRVLTERGTIDRAALASVGDGLIVTNRDADILLMNPIAETLLGFAPSEAIGKKYFDAILMQREDGSPVPTAERPILMTLSEGRRIMSSPFGSMEYYVRKNGERFPVAYTKTPIVVDGSIIGAIEVFRDATQEKKVDQAKSEFISFASHQLRTPLSVVGLTSELLQRQGELFGPYDEEEVGSYVQEIQEATQQMNDIINDLLNVSRIESQSLRPLLETVEVKKIIGKDLKTLAPKIAIKKLTISTHFPRESTECVTDPQFLQIVVQNLLSNAIKYTPEGGTIEIAMTRDQSYLTIRFSDTGFGIPDHEQQNIFQKLFRASNARGSGTEGSGLGLYIVKAMLVRLGGDISFVSKEGAGTTFVVRLPVGNASGTMSE